MTDAAPASDKAAARRLGFRFGAGLVAGALVGAAIAFLDKDERLLELGALPSITLAVAAGLFLAGLALVALSYRRDALALAVGSGEGPATVKEASMMRLSGWVLALSAALAAAPPLAVLALDPITPRMGGLLVAALALATLAHAGLNVMVWRRADELTRRASLEAAAGAFVLFESGLFIWAAAAMLGVAPEISAWAIWMAMFGLYILAAVWVSARRGLS